MLPKLSTGILAGVLKKNNKNKLLKLPFACLSVEIKVPEILQLLI